MEETMLRLNAFSNNHHPSRVKMLAKYIRRGISVTDNIKTQENICSSDMLTFKIK
jgi:hypothetical protein